MKMFRRGFVLVTLCLFTLSSWAALTAQQLITLKAAIAAETDVGFVASRVAGATGEMRDFYNASHPSFVVWRTLVGVRETGQAFNGSEWAGMTSANHTRLTDVALWVGTGYDASKADVRAMFNDIWSGAGGATTRANLLALWKRFAKRGERLFATGTGTDAVPGLLVFEGNITNDDIVQAIALP